MKKLLYYFSILLVAVWVGLKIAVDPGYILIAYQKTTLEMPLWFGVVSIMLLFSVFYLVCRLVSNMRSLGSRFREWSAGRRLRRAWQRTHRGLIALGAGEWALAEKELIRAAPETDTAIINYLAAAYAAQAQAAIGRRDDYFRHIQPCHATQSIAAGLIQAQLQLNTHQYEQALAHLQQLQQLKPRHQTVLLLLKKVYLHLQDWGSLEILLSSLYKYKILTIKQLEKLSLHVYEGLLKSADNHASATLIWQRAPKSLRYVAVLLNAYIPFLSQDYPDDAEELLYQALKKNGDNRLLLQYGLITSNRLDRQLARAESLLTQHPDNATLLLTLGRLCVKNALWGKARSYFEASLAISVFLDTYQALGELFEKLGESEKALACYKKGLLLMIKR